MQRTALLLIVGGLCAIWDPVLRAAEPTGPATSPPVRTTTAGATGGVAQVAPAQSAQPSIQLGAADADEDKFLRQQGYKPEMRRGVRYYCRSAATLGSRFPQTTCLTAEQSRDIRQHSKDMTERAQRMQTNPTGG